MCRATANTSCAHPRDNRTRTRATILYHSYHAQVGPAPDGRDAQWKYFRFSVLHVAKYIHPRNHSRAQPPLGLLKISTVMSSRSTKCLGPTFVITEYLRAQGAPTSEPHEAGTTSDAHTTSVGEDEECMRQQKSRVAARGHVRFEYVLVAPHVSPDGS